MTKNDNITVPVTINVMLVGKTGAGKSTLVNTIFGVDTEAKVEHGASACKHDKPVTPYHLPLLNIIEGMSTQVVIYDTTGFGESDKQDNELLKYVKNHVNKIHLLLVCHKLYDKVDSSTARFLKALVEYCSEDILHNMIFLLTHADGYMQTKLYRKSNDKGSAEIKEEFTAKHENMKALLCTTIGNLYPKIDVKKIPFCLTCDDTEIVLPNITNWEYEMWLFILHKCDDEAKVILSYWARVMHKIELN